MRHVSMPARGLGRGDRLAANLDGRRDARSADCRRSGAAADPRPTTQGAGSRHAAKVLVTNRYEHSQPRADVTVRCLCASPEVHDGYDRLGMVYEARGDHQRAAECYREVIDFVRAHPDQYEPDFEDTFHRLITKLDSSPAS
jgi:hypothetical protein